MVWPSRTLLNFGVDSNPDVDLRLLFTSVNVKEIGLYVIYYHLVEAGGDNAMALAEFVLPEHVLPLDGR